MAHYIHTKSVRKWSSALSTGPRAHDNRWIAKSRGLAMGNSMFWLIWTGSLFCGYFTQLEGRVYFGDILFLFGLVALFVNQNLQASRIEAWTSALILTLYITFTAFDVYNGIAAEDTIRGSLRNLGSITAAYTAYFITTQYSLRRAEALLITSLVSIAFFAIFLNPEYRIKYDLALRWEWGALVPVALIYIVQKWNSGALFISASLFILGGICITFLDMRSFGAIYIATGSLIIGARFKKFSQRNKVIFMLLAIVALLIGGLFLADQLNTTDTEILDRRDQSNRQRIEMATDAIKGVLERPFIGHGSWQHARTYIDSVFSTLIVGVHSVVIQMSYEYGVLGGVTALTCIILLMRALYLLMMNLNTTGFVPVVSILFLVNGIYYLIMSPLGGSGRFILGLTVGIAAGVIALARKSTRITAQG